MLRKLVGITFAGLGLALTISGAQAQNHYGNPLGTSVQITPNGVNVNDPGFGFNPYNFNIAPGYSWYGSPIVDLGGPYGYNYGPPIAVTPNGVVPLGGYNNGNNFDPSLNNNENNDTAQNRQTGTRQNAISLRRLGSRQVVIAYNGDTSSVSDITFALLDKNHKVISRRNITAPPASARFTRTRKSAFYAVQVHFNNGRKTTSISAL